MFPHTGPAIVPTGQCWSRCGTWSWSASRVRRWMWCWFQGWPWGRLVTLAPNTLVGFALQFAILCKKFIHTRKCFLSLLFLLRGRVPPSQVVQFCGVSFGPARRNPGRRICCTRSPSCVLDNQQQTLDALESSPVQQSYFFVFFSARKLCFASVSRRGRSKTGIVSSCFCVKSIFCRNHLHTAFVNFCSEFLFE